jgi:hypothetical protein
MLFIVFMLILVFDLLTDSALSVFRDCLYTTVSLGAKQHLAHSGVDKYFLN